jgi:hypothetical protein
MSQTRCVALAGVLAVAASVGACRWQSTTPVTTGTGEFGTGTGGFTAQCSGDFPDWISETPPTPGADVNPSEPGNQQPFQLAQAYPLGIPVFSTTGSTPVVDHWNPPPANQDAPWRATISLATPANRDAYQSSLKSYLLEGMSDAGVEFNAVKNNAMNGHRKWFHVPMMTAAGPRRREPFHGVTAERLIRSNEQPGWLKPGNANNLKAVAIGYYNFLGGYTIGQVFPSFDLSQSDASKGKLIDGTFVFKLLFAQYAPSHNLGADPLLHSPAWFVQDPSAPSSPLMEVRLLQVDVAVKDDHFPATGWVFSTFVYDESLAVSEANPWRRLTPIGLQAGNDPSVTSSALAPLSETWLGSSIPSAFAFNSHHGRAGRLIGPVDNPVSSCISCHSTAQVDPSQAGNAVAYLGASFVPPSGCSPAQEMQWFRNLPSGPAGSQAFGRSSGCVVDTSTTGLQSLDYSLQLQEGLQSVFGFNNGNPCATLAQEHHRAEDAAASSSKARSLVKERKLLKLEPKTKLMGPAPDDAHSR